MTYLKSEKVSKIIKQPTILSYIKKKKQYNTHLKYYANMKIKKIFELNPCNINKT